MKITNTYRMEFRKKHMFLIKCLKVLLLLWLKFICLKISFPMIHKNKRVISNGCSACAKWNLFFFNCFQLFTNILLYSILVVFFEMEVSLKQPDNLPNCFYLNSKLIQNNQLGKNNKIHACCFEILM